MALTIKIGGKLAASAAISSLFVAGIIGNQWFNNRAILAGIDTVSREQTILDGISGAQIALTRMQTEFKAIELARTPEALAAALAAIRKEAQDGAKGLEQPIAIAMKPQVLKDAQSSLGRYAQAAETFARNGRAELRGEPADAAGAAAARKAISDITADAGRTIEESVANAHRFTEAATTSVTEQVGAATRFGLLAGLAALLVMIGSAVFLLVNVARPIRRIGEVLLQLASGQTAVAIPFTDRGDEVGENARAAQSFKDSLLAMHRLEEETALARAGAEAQRKAGMREMADGFESAVGGIVGMVSSAATELQTTARAMSATAAETASQSTAAAAASEEAAANVSTVAAAAEQLGSSVQEIGRQVDGSADLARRAVQEATHSAELVQELSEAAARIGDVVRMISDIAGQTNLLALNATIEAARAGEAGRGFAVVAAEVKELASQTARATDEIGGQIARIQGATGESVKAIDGIATPIREISAVATTIAAAVEEQGAATQEIVRNVGQAASGTSAVTANVAGVAGAAEQTGAAAAQVLSSAGGLSQHSEHLTAELHRFLGSIRAA